MARRYRLFRPFPERLQQRKKRGIIDVNKQGKGGIVLILYAIIMFLSAALFFVLSAAIYRGKTNLINSYHQENVKAEDRLKYGRAFARGLFLLAMSLLLSGAIPLFVRSSAGTKGSLVILFGGILIALFMIVRTQKKFNGGIF